MSELLEEDPLLFRDLERTLAGLMYGYGYGSYGTAGWIGEVEGGWTWSGSQLSSSSESVQGERTDATGESEGEEGGEDPGEDDRIVTGDCGSPSDSLVEGIDGKESTRSSGGGCSDASSMPCPSCHGTIPHC